MISVWFAYALLTAVVYAAIALLAKVVSGASIDDPVTLAVYSCVPFYAVYIVAGVVLEWAAISEASLASGTASGAGGGTEAIALALAFGVISTAAYGVYYWGLVNGDVSRFVPTLSLETVFVLGLGFLILGEAFPADVYAGVGLVVLGALAISYERETGSLRSSLRFSTVGVAIIAAFAFAVFNTGMKVLTESFGTVELLFWISLGGLLSVLAIAPFRAGARFGAALDPRQAIQHPDQLATGTRLLLVGGLLNAVGLFTFIRALEFGPVSLATAVTKLDVLLVFVGALSLSKLVPAVLEEEFDPFTLVQKGTASMLVVAGCVLIQVGYA
ncbi:EamA family transporter [Natrialba sp. SSL1]|uniref:EamA family transporter n=1 Tax=Natrialba sp. SSL1 TaxID=1869245 RepID=UPI0008F97169|nr:EamA family transporter [Natrialba sp. SSL1]OIB59223.1 hypothetical protein BBD46_00640 [Natrialba sp. SSL1]